MGLIYSKYLRVGGLKAIMPIHTMNLFIYILSNKWLQRLEMAQKKVLEVPDMDIV
ncbi:Uncharacterised protein [Pasteurella multocida subsp. septica]|nr:Uncharacterised protein [Pasteurella multocida subsp. septica]